MNLGGGPAMDQLEFRLHVTIGSSRIIVMRDQPKPETIRAFIAANLPDNLRLAISALQDRLRNEADIPGIRWTPAEQVHLTLKFLGNVPETALGGLAAALQRACAGQRAIHLRLEQLGCFPELESPKIIWLGIAGHTQNLEALQTRIEQQTAPLSGHDEERLFHPHLTLARVKHVSPPERSRLVQIIQARQTVMLGDWVVHEVALVKSLLSSAGPTYTALAVIPLETT